MREQMEKEKRSDEVTSLVSAGVDPYVVLGVDRAATTEQLRTAYRSAALRWHPDKHTPADRAEAAERFAAIRRAYEVVGSAALRSEWDRLHRRPPEDRPLRRRRGAAWVCCLLLLLAAVALGSLSAPAQDAALVTPAPANLSGAVLPPADVAEAVAAAAESRPALAQRRRRPRCELQVQYNTRREGNANLEPAARAAASAENCSTACAATAGCRCFTWNGENSRCWLMSRCGTRTSRAGRRWHFVSGEGGCSVGGGEPVCVRGLEYDSADPANAALPAASQHRPSAELCGSLCAETAGCACFSWDGGTDACYLFSTCGGAAVTRPDGVWVSGQPGCALQPGCSFSALLQPPPSARGRGCAPGGVVPPEGACHFDKAGHTCASAVCSKAGYWSVDAVSCAATAGCHTSDLRPPAGATLLGGWDGCPRNGGMVQPGGRCKFVKRGFVCMGPVCGACAEGSACRHGGWGNEAAVTCRSMGGCDLTALKTPAGAATRCDTVGMMPNGTRCKFTVRGGSCEDARCVNAEWSPAEPRCTLYGCSYSRLRPPENAVAGGSPGCGERTGTVASGGRCTFVSADGECDPAACRAGACVGPRVRASAFFWSVVAPLCGGQGRGLPFLGRDGAAPPLGELLQLRRRRGQTGEAVAAAAGASHPQN